MMREVLLIVVAMSALGCVSNRYKEFSHVKPGMEKDQVIDEAGGPNVSRRYHGKDRWIYTYETKDGRKVREVHFDDGQAVYVGDKLVPKVSAEEQDRINEQSNAEEDKRETAEHIRWAEEHGVAYKPKTGSELDNDDIRLQEGLYGTRDLKRERKKVAPDFKDVN